MQKKTKKTGCVFHKDVPEPVPKKKGLLQLLQVLKCYSAMFYEVKIHVVRTEYYPRLFSRFGEGSHILNVD